jgi:hypothetical protein
MMKNNLSVYSEDPGLSIPSVEGSSPSMRSINPIMGTRPCSNVEQTNV